MINQIIDTIKHLEKKIIQIMQYGFLVALLIGCLSSIVLVTYELNPISLDLYYSGLLLFKTSLMVAVQFIICGFAFDTIKKHSV